MILDALDAGNPTLGNIIPLDQICGVCKCRTTKTTYVPSLRMGRGVGRHLYDVLPYHSRLPSLSILAVPRHLQAQHFKSANSCS